MVGLPDKCWLERGEVLGAGLGITKHDLASAVRMSLVGTTTFNGARSKRKKYWREDVVSVFGSPADRE